MNITPKNIREEALEEFNNTSPNPTTIENPNPNQCKFHLDDEKFASDSNTLFCGKPCWVDKTSKHHSYCWYHYEITHERKNNT